jgi:hypothetical protein
MSKYLGSIIGLLFLAAIVVLLVTGDSQKNAVIVLETGAEIPCLPHGHQQVASHIHPVLTVLVDGEQEMIPQNLGITGTCMRELHTHDSSGAIHIETEELGVTYTLADFLAVWGEPADRAGYELEIIQDGEVKESPADVIFTDHSDVQMVYTSIEE